MPHHENGPKKLQSSPARLVIGLLHEALSQESVTNRSLYPQELVTAVSKVVVLGENGAVTDRLSALGYQNWMRIV